MDVDQDHPHARRVRDAYAQLDAGDVRAFFGLFHRNLRFHFLIAMPSIAGAAARPDGGSG